MLQGRVEPARQVACLGRIERLVQGLADGRHIVEELVHLEALQLGRQFLHGGADGRDLPDGRIGGDKARRLVRVEIEVDIELSGEDALHPQARPQAALHQSVDRLAIPQIDLFAAAPTHDMRLDLDGDRDSEIVAGIIEPKLDMLDGSYLDAEENHRRAHLQSVRRAFEIQNVTTPLAKPLVAGDQQDGHDCQRNCAEDKGAYQGRIGSSAHAVPLVKKCRTFGSPDWSA